MPDQTDISSALVAINRDLSLEDDEKMPIELSMEKVRTMLTALVKRLLDHDFERLLTAMYRIDISEQKFKEALNAPDPDNVAPAIAELILNRQLQKIEIRKKYGS